MPSCGGAARSFDDHRIILEKPLLDILPLGGWDDPRPPGNACEFHIVLGHYVAERLLSTVTLEKLSGFRENEIAEALVLLLPCGSLLHLTAVASWPGTGLFLLRLRLLAQVCSYRTGTRS